MRLVTGAELAKEISENFNRAAVTMARNRGKIIQDEDGLYDLDHPDTAEWILKQLHNISRKQHQQLDPSPPKPKQKTVKPKRKTVPKKSVEKKTTDKKPKRKTVVKKDKADPKAKDKNKGVNHAARAAGNSRAEKDLELLDIKIKRAELDYEIATKSVIMRDDIQFVWNKIFKSASYFGDFGQKYSSVWAAALGISDPAKIDDLQKMIDEATELFMRDFTETVAGEI